MAVLLGSGTLLGLGGYFLVTAEDCRREAGVLLGMGLLFGLLGIWNEGLMTREYAIDTEGITLRYWKRKTVFYPWSQISKIYAYERHAGSARDEVIRCTIGEPTKAPRGLPTTGADMNSSVSGVCSPWSIHRSGWRPLSFAPAGTSRTTDTNKTLQHNCRGGSASRQVMYLSVPLNGKMLGKL